MKNEPRTIDTTTRDTTERIVIAGAGYGGLHVAQRLAAGLERHEKSNVDLTLVDAHDYHQIITELPRVATGTRSESAVRVPLDRLLERRATFVQTSVRHIDLDRQELVTSSGALPYTRLVLALGSEPRGRAIPGVTEHALSVQSVNDATRVWDRIRAAVQLALGSDHPEEQRRLLTVVVVGAGATGVEMAGALAEELPALARLHGIAPHLPRVLLLDGGSTVLAGAAPRLSIKASAILTELGVEVRLHTRISAVTAEGVQLAGGAAIAGHVIIWAGGLGAPKLVADSGLSTSVQGRVDVDRYLRARSHPEVYVAGDLAAVVEPETGQVVPPLAQAALEEGETVAHNLLAELTGRPLKAFSFLDKGFVVSVGGRKGVATVAGMTQGGRLAHVLKDAIEWEYREAITRMHGWGAI